MQSTTFPMFFLFSLFFIFPFVSSRVTSTLAIASISSNFQSLHYKSEETPLPHLPPILSVSNSSWATLEIGGGGIWDEDEWGAPPSPLSPPGAVFATDGNLTGLSRAWGLTELHEFGQAWTSQGMSVIEGGRMGHVPSVRACGAVLRHWHAWRVCGAGRGLGGVVRGKLLEQAHIGSLKWLVTASKVVLEAILVVDKDESWKEKIERSSGECADEAGVWSIDEGRSEGGGVVSSRGVRVYSSLRMEDVIELRFLQPIPSPTLTFHYPPFFVPYPNQATFTTLSPPTQSTTLFGWNSSAPISIAPLTNITTPHLTITLPLPPIPVGHGVRLRMPLHGTFQHVESFPVDAHRGIDLPAICVSSNHISLSSPSHPCIHWIRPFPVEPPLPDASMPYNVAVIATTALLYMLLRVYNASCKLKVP